MFFFYLLWLVLQLKLLLVVSLLSLHRFQAYRSHNTVHAGNSLPKMTVCLFSTLFIYTAMHFRIRHVGGIRNCPSCWTIFLDSNHHFADCCLSACSRHVLYWIAKVRLLLILKGCLMGWPFSLFFICTVCTVHMQTGEERPTHKASFKRRRSLTFAIQYSTS